MKREFLKYTVVVVFLTIMGKGMLARPMISLGGDRYNDADIVSEAYYYAGLLGLEGNVAIRINFTLGLPSGVLGTVDVNVENEFAQVVIWIDRKAGRSAQMSTLAHEMVHASQLLYQEMKILESNRVGWKDGNIYDLKETDYHDRPWEEDAHERSSRLRKQFLRKGRVNLII